MPKLSDHDVTNCERCGDRIRWTVTAAGKPHPVNADPDDTEFGNTAAYYDGTGRLRSRGLSKERPVLEHHEWRAIPHFTNCSSPPPRRSGGGGQRARTQVRPAPWQR
ncbi:hypothetical protein SMICM304S_08461 [Streptomyces microflavus]